jgi:hypothetical protein
MFQDYEALILKQPADKTEAHTRAPNLHTLLGL